MDWLQRAGLIYHTPRINEPAIPIGAYRDGAFKLYFLDVGLLGAKVGLSTSVLLEKTAVFREFKGALTEQYVQQQLRAECGISPYYWSAERAQAEVDFLIECDYHVLPVEVKAERNLQAKSLRSFCKRYQYPVALRLSLSHHDINTVHIAHDEHSYTVVDVPLYAVSAVPDEMAAVFPSLPFC